jgi:hypothetical protein
VRFGFNPKKSGPDHAVPVIFRAKSLKPTPQMVQRR